MKEKLIGFAIGAALVAALFSAYGFKGTAQASGSGTFRIYSTADETYLLNTSTGATWRESAANSWLPIKQPSTAFGPVGE